MLRYYIIQLYTRSYIITYTLSRLILRTRIGAIVLNIIRRPELFATYLRLLYYLI